jgi:hypothetical protein
MYYLIPIAILFIVLIISKGSGVSPLASGQVREICEHMTSAERMVLVRMGALFGLGIALVLAGIGCVLGVFVFDSILMGMTVSPLIAPVVGLLIRKRIFRWQRDFLASTVWAKSQEINADSIHLFRWQK